MCLLGPTSRNTSCSRLSWHEAEQQPWLSGARKTEVSAYYAEPEPSDYKPYRAHQSFAASKDIGPHYANALQAVERLPLNDSV